MDKEPNITVYEGQIPEAIAEHLSGMFERNYPESHSDEEKERDVSQRSGPVAIQGLITIGHRLHVAFTENGKPAGFLEEQTIPVEGGVYEQLVWIIVDEYFRGKGLAGLLYQSFLRTANKRATERDQPTMGLLNVNANNPAREIYEHWGFSFTDDPTTESGKKMMTMPLPK